MVVTWTLLAPVVVLVSTGRATLQDVRRWRRHDIDVTELLARVSANGLYLSLGIGSMLSPVTAGVFLASAAWIESGTLKRLAARGRRKQPPRPPPDPGSG